MNQGEEGSGSQMDNGLATSDIRDEVCDLLLQRTIFSQTGAAYQFRAGEARSWILLACMR